MKTVAWAVALATSAVLATGGPAVAWTGDYAVATADRFDQRTDVEEVLLPPPPTGPASPIPFCSPSAPICP